MSQTIILANGKDTRHQTMTRPIPKNDATQFLSTPCSQTPELSIKNIQPKYYSIVSKPLNHGTGGGLSSTTTQHGLIPPEVFKHSKLENKTPQMAVSILPPLRTVNRISPRYQQNQRNSVNQRAQSEFEESGLYRSVQ